MAQTEESKKLYGIVVSLFRQKNHNNLECTYGGSGGGGAPFTKRTNHRDTRAHTNPIHPYTSHSQPTHTNPIEGDRKFEQKKKQKMLFSVLFAFSASTYSCFHANNES